MIILDLDNCISDDEWRIPSINWQKKDPTARYHDYHALAPFDTIHNYHLWVGQRCIIFTARPVAFRAPTVEWLRRCGVQFEFLLMRNDNDHRPSCDLKATQLKWLEELYGVAKHEIEMAHDDRQDVVEMYLAAGVSATRTFIHSTCAYTKRESVNER